MVDRTHAAIEAELAEARLELLRVRADASVLASKLRSVMLQTEIETAVVRRSMAVAAESQRIAAQVAAQVQRDMDAVLKSSSWRVTRPLRQLGEKLERFKQWQRRSKADVTPP